jgi:hypothetical protein
MRTVTIYLPDGEIGGSTRLGATTKERYTFRPGDICIVDPPNKKKLKHRGRLCRLTETCNKYAKVRVNFIDEIGGYGYVDAVDLIPGSYPQKTQK